MYQLHLLVFFSYWKDIRSKLKGNAVLSLAEAISLDHLSVFYLLKKPTRVTVLLRCVIVKLIILKKLLEKQIFLSQQLARLNL